MGDLPRNERVRDVDEAQALRKPRERDHGAVETLRRLVATAHRRLRAAVDVKPGYLECRDRHRQLLERDVVNPGEGGGRRPQLGGVLVPPPRCGGAFWRAGEGRREWWRARKRGGGRGRPATLRP